jgi:hypothetical protein
MDFWTFTQKVGFHFYLGFKVLPRLTIGSSELVELSTHITRLIGSNPAGAGTGKTKYWQITLLSLLDFSGITYFDNFSAAPSMIKNKLRELSVPLFGQVLLFQYYTSWDLGAYCIFTILHFLRNLWTCPIS